MVDTTEIRSHGKATVRWQGRHLTVQLDSVRRALMAMVSLMGAVFETSPLQSGVEPLRWLIGYAESLQLQALLVGLAHTDRG